MVRVHLGVHVVESTEGKVHGVFAGDFLETFREAVALNEQVFRFSIDRRADIVIVSAGGAQWDRTLFDASPAAMIVSNACKDRGVIILVAECAEGLGKLPSTQPVTRDSKAHRLQVRKTFTLERLMEHALRRLSAEHRVYLVSTLPEHQASLYGLLPAGSVGIALQRALRHVNKEASVVVVPNGSLTAPIVR
jgi:nickel-dependent lactate racemase